MIWYQKQTKVLRKRCNDAIEWPFTHVFDHLTRNMTCIQNRFVKMDTIAFLLLPYCC